LNGILTFGFFNTSEVCGSDLDFNRELCENPKYPTATIKNNIEKKRMSFGEISFFIAQSFNGVCNYNVRKARK